MQKECENNPFESTIAKYSLDFINRQKEEFERLNSRITTEDEIRAIMKKLILQVINEIKKEQFGSAISIEKSARKSAIREFAEELKKRASKTFISHSNGYSYITDYQFSPETIDNLVKEMTEEDNNDRPT